MQITLKVTLWKHKKDKAGNCPIAIAIRGGGEETYYNTGIKVPEKLWDGSKILKGVANNDILNNSLYALVGGTEREILLRQNASEELTLDDVKAILKPDTKPVGKSDRSTDFHAFYAAYIKLLESQCTKGYVEHRKVEHRQLKKFAPKLCFADVTDDFLEAYEMQLKCAPTTKHTKMKRLKEVVKRAVAKGKIPHAQVASYKLPSYVEPEADYLTLQQIETITNAVYTGELDFNANMKKIACYFTIECYSGIRFSDWHRFKIETLVHERNLKVRARKNHEPVYLPLNIFTRLGAMVDYIIANNMVFDIKERETNITLRALGAMLKIPVTDLTTHVGRHTCGTLLGEMGYNDREIADVLGISEETARRYRRTTRQGLNNAFEKFGGL